MKVGDKLIIGALEDWTDDIGFKCYPNYSSILSIRNPSPEDFYYEVEIKKIFKAKVSIEKVSGG